MPFINKQSRMVTSLVLAALLVGASQLTGSIAGVITDTSSRGLPGATIIATSDEGAVRRTATDVNGRYSFAGLPPGRYRIEASMPGFEAKAQALTVVSAREEIWSGALLVAPPLGAGSIERRLIKSIGWNARDCGRHDSAASDAALQRSLECALASAGAGEPFAVIVQSASDTSHAGFGLLGGTDGVVHVFRYDKGGLTFHAQPCPVSELMLRRHAFACGPRPA
jgi:hypothetical protein